MSLILAAVSDNDGFFVADTLLTHKFDDPSKGSGPFNGKFHALKVHILNQHLCIALAGDYGLGLSVINRISNYVIKNKNAIDKRLFQKIFSIYQVICNEHDRSLHACDFLIMLNIPGKPTILAKITHAGLEFSEKAYIGNPDAYHKLQSLRQPYIGPKYQSSRQPDGTFKIESFKPSEIEKNFCEIRAAMERASNHTKDADVAIMGDSVICVRVTRSGDFVYLQQANRGISPEEGSFGIALLASQKPKYGIGIFYATGSFGDLFIACDEEYCRRVKASTFDEFKEIAYRDYQLILEGPTW